jgi:hypothetical protein
MTSAADPFEPGRPAAPHRAELQDRTFRLNPAYRFVARDALTAAQLRHFGVTALESGYAGVLMPAGTALPAKAVCASTAALVLGLRRPRRLPPAARASLDADGNDLARLVLDSVLELKCGDRFATGVAASELLAFTRAAAAPSTRIAQLSRAALDCASALPIDSPVVLAARLYCFNSVPASPAWAQRLQTRTDVARFLGIGRGQVCGRLLATDWAAPGDPAQHPNWLSWRARRPGAQRASWKLYLSVAIADLPQAFAQAVNVATELALPGFKIGCDLHGLQRPDKCVLYVNSREQLRELGARLSRRLRGARAQGTPFSAAIDADGTLSWGIDPQPRAGEPDSASWRRWLTDRLATALLAARRARAGARVVDAPQFALARLRLDGIDTDRWMPDGDTWNGTADAGD